MPGSNAFNEPDNEEAARFQNRRSYDRSAVVPSHLVNFSRHEAGVCHFRVSKPNRPVRPISVSNMVPADIES